MSRSVLAILGIAFLIVVVLTHVAERWHFFPEMGWGLPHMPGPLPRSRERNSWRGAVAWRLDLASNFKLGHYRISGIFDGGPRGEYSRFRIEHSTEGSPHDPRRSH